MHKRKIISAVLVMIILLTNINISAYAKSFDGEERQVFAGKNKVHSLNESDAPKKADDKNELGELEEITISEDVESTEEIDDSVEETETSEKVDDSVEETEMPEEIEGSVEETETPEESENSDEEQPSESIESSGTESGEDDSSISENEIKEEKINETSTVLSEDVLLDESDILVLSNVDNCNDFIAPIDKPDASAIKITTAEELYNVRNDLYGSYVLMNDIDLSSYEDWDPIGSPKTFFAGKFDGQGHSITGLTIKENFTSGTILPPSYAVGLFGVCSGAQIKNLALTNADVSVITSSGYGYSSAINGEYSVYAGIIAGYITDSTVIYNCCTAGTVYTKAYEEAQSASMEGGLVGLADKAIISYCSNAAGVQSFNGNAANAYNAYAGGLVGRFSTEGTIDRSYNNGMVYAITLDFGNAYAGGLIGSDSNSTIKITDCYNKGQIQGKSGNMFCDTVYAGGIVAEFSGSINNVYNSGSVESKAGGYVGGTAYAGGICGISLPDASISNAAILQSTVAASSESGSSYQYRISHEGNKTNTITISTVTAGSTNDAEIIKSIDDMKISDPYINLLGWDFENIWEMVIGIEFPQLKVVDTESEDYKDEYVVQHLEYIDSPAYADLLENYRWAQIYWSQENNFTSNLGEKLYDGVDTVVDLLQFNFAALFDEGNPYKIILADYVADQTVEEELLHLYKKIVPYSLDTTYKKVKKFIQDNWKDAYGELSEEDLFWLFHYEDKSSDEWVNSNFEKNIKAIIYDEKTEGFETVLGITTETFDLILEQKKNLDNTVDWVNGLIDYSGHVAAYVSADEEFKIILERMCENFPDTTLTERKYKNQLLKAIKSYTQYNNKESITAQIFANYVAGNVEKKKKKTIQKQINNQITNWIKATFSATALAAIEKIGWAADVTWNIMEFVTKNGDLQECREALRANAYFEDTMYHTLRSIENAFKTDQTIENARLYDAAFKFFKETEIYSMGVCMTYMDTYQTAWLSALRNHSNTFMNSAIEEVHINKLFLYNSYCHGISYSLGGKVITIACPTNVYIYDENGNLVLRTENPCANISVYFPDCNCNRRCEYI